jgi:hypothetical protein
VTARRPACVAVAAVVLLLSREANTEPLRTRSDAVCTSTDGLRSIDLPAGWYLLPPDDYDELDAELKARGDTVTALRAENARLRAGEGGGGSVWAAVAVIGVAVAGGVALGWKLR